MPLSNEFHKARSGNPQHPPGYLCPDVSSDSDLLRIQGGYNNEHFDYIKLSVRHCKKSDLLEPDESCASVEEIYSQKSLRLYLPESSVNYESRDTKRAVEWSLHNFFILQLELASTRKQDIFISKSEIYFENKWSPVEIQDKGVPFVEF